MDLKQELPSRISKTLNSGEEVFHFAKNIGRINWFDRFAMVFTLVFCLIIAAAVVNTYFLLLLIPLFLASNYTVPFLNFIMGKPKPYIAITSEGIRTNKEFTPWESVHEIGYRLKSRQQILAFYLTYNHDDYANQKLNFNKTYVLPNSIFLGGRYDPDELLSKINPHWKPKSPRTRLKEIGVQLSNKYALSEINTRPGKVRFFGAYKNMKIAYEYKDSLPFETIESAIHLPKPLPFYMEINEETSLSKIGQTFGQKDIKVGWMSVDKHFQFKSSHPTIVEELFTLQMIRLLQRIKNIGIVEWSFGNPLKLEKRTTQASTIDDTEDVLDTGLLQLEEENQPKNSISDNSYNDRLDFVGLLHPNDKENLEKTKEFVELGVELSVLLSEQLIIHGEKAS